MHLRGLLSQTHQQIRVRVNLSFNHETTAMHSLGFENMRAMPLTKNNNVKTTHHSSMIWGKANQRNTNKDTFEHAHLNLTIKTAHQPNATWGVFCGQPQMLTHTPTEKQFGNSRASNECQASPSLQSPRAPANHLDRTDAEPVDDHPSSSFFSSTPAKAPLETLICFLK